ncbi:Lysyl oxidase 2 [Amphibalanus amphitrite]|uniref:protein-lysine 6-oxidase n=1 Tax=Amphibalanus amphitrite TaxID=1232801 RepID=A0A6A4VR28_AMPAM|nr:Lysyl oxidase 2 [Amphibalanus amphitrite]
MRCPVWLVVGAAVLAAVAGALARQRLTGGALQRLQQLRRLRRLREQRQRRLEADHETSVEPDVLELEAGAEVPVALSNVAALVAPATPTPSAGRPVAPAPGVSALSPATQPPQLPTAPTLGSASRSNLTYLVQRLEHSTERPSVSSTPEPGVEGQLRVSGGRGPFEGNVEIFHDGRWGYICDDEWDMAEAEIACQQLGYQTAQKPTHDGFYGHPEGEISFWMDNMYCLGNERRLSQCRFDGWAQHDCAPSELAGVSCRGQLEDAKATKAPALTTAEPAVPKTSLWHTTKGRLKARLRGGRVPSEGRLELKIGDDDWGLVCGDGWSLLTANVACRTLGLGYAAAALQTGFFGGNGSTKVMSGLECIGNESVLINCRHDEQLFCPGDPQTNIATVVCQPEMADLVPDHEAMMQSAYLEDRQLFYLQCAMEENCLAASAYRIRKENADWHVMPRRLLRFTTKVANRGSAAFRPLLPKEAWEWHACHMHYHSMEVFSTYEVIDDSGRRVAEGHKASFCLEDSSCSAGVEPGFSCANFGDQGISVGCADSYAHNIDCQWLDVTDIDPGRYRLRVVINGEYKVGEQSWENNAVTCDFNYQTTVGTVTNCHLGRP